MWPDIRRFRYERFRLELFGGDEARARQAFELYTGRLPTDRKQCRRALVDAVHGRASAIRAAAIDSIMSCVERDSLNPDHAIQTLAYFGEIERAFLVLSTRMESDRFWPGVLFVPATASLRRDRRFAEIVDAIGIAEFWRTSGWPDFCDEPDLAIECLT
jgi:hypothetical protein